MELQGCQDCEERTNRLECRSIEKDCLTPKVIQIDNETIILFHTVDVLPEQGDEESFPPLNGLYKNTLLYYQVNDHAYLYNSDGIPRQIGWGEAAAGVTKEYVDGQDAITLNMAKTYTDTALQEYLKAVNGVIVEDIE